MSKKNKVAIVSSGLGHVRRGIETWAEELAYLLKDVGVDVTLFKGGGKPLSSIEKVVPCIKRNSLLLGGVNSWISWGQRLLIEELTFSFFLLNRLRDDYDIIHLAQPVMVRRLLKAKEEGKISSEVIFSNQGGLTLKEFEKFEHVQVSAPYYLEEAKKSGIDIKNWFCVPNFVDTNKFRPSRKPMLRKMLKIPSDSFVILSVGAINKRYKKMDRIIEEVATLKERTQENIRLIIAGEAEDETPSVIKYGRKLLEKDVVFLLGIPHANMPIIYSTADVFALGTINEVFGITFLEAMSCGVPVLGHNFAVSKWIIGDGGTTVDMTRRGMLAKALEDYLNEDYRERTGNKARERVKKMFSSEVVIKDILKMYDAVMGKKMCGGG